MQKCIWRALCIEKHPKFIDLKCHNRQLSSDGEVLTMGDGVKIDLISVCIAMYIDFSNKSDGGGYRE